MTNTNFRYLFHWDVPRINHKINHQECKCVHHLILHSIKQWICWNTWQRTVQYSWILSLSVAHRQPWHPGTQHNIDWGCPKIFVEIFWIWFFCLPKMRVNLELKTSFVAIMDILCHQHREWQQQTLDVDYCNWRSLRKPICWIHTNINIAIRLTSINEWLSILLYGKNAPPVTSSQPTYPNKVIYTHIYYTIHLWFQTTVYRFVIHKRLFLAIYWPTDY